MTPTLPFGPEPLGLELGAERLEAEWRLRVINLSLSMEMSFLQGTGGCLFLPYALSIN